MSACPVYLHPEDCRYCGVRHDRETHEVTLDLRAWLRSELERRVPQIRPQPVAVPKPEPVKKAAARVSSPKPRQSAGRGQGWNRVEGLTPEAVLAAYGRGLKTPQIAREFKCRPQTISDNLVRWRRGSAEFRAVDDALRTCPDCPNPKARSSERCSVCAARARKREAANA